MSCCFAIIPDTATSPAAVFSELEDAIDWAVARYGDDKFRIQYLPLMRIERAEQRGAAGPV